jgi:hypothetical protein
MRRRTETEIDMKRKFLIAAGLLCLGSSPAFAFAMPDMAPDMAKAVKQVWADQLAAEQQAPGIFDTGEAWMGTAKAPKPIFAAASADKDAFDLSAKADDAIATSGPSEPILKADADANAVPAAAAYPPCSRGAGDDHCIQLYERGVRAQLAGWNRSASGTETAMGGPYEPVDSTMAGELGGKSVDGTANGDGVIDTSAGETADAAMPAGAQYTGMGGPLEEVDYPACSRTVTDRCIQLYERGVHR